MQHKPMESPLQESNSGENVILRIARQVAGHEQALRELKEQKDEERRDDIDPSRWSES